MPKITEVQVTVGRTQNTGNFNSLRIDLSATAAVEEGEDHHVVLADLTAELKRKAIEYLWEAKETYATDWPAAPR